MGHVFRVLDRQLGREVALKLIVPRYLGRPEREQRFLLELELGQRAGRHPHLVEVLGGGRSRESDWPFLVMELVEGKMLANRLARGPLLADVAARIARQVAGAVRALHRCGVVHRDITPMNVLAHHSDAVLIDLSHAGDASAPRLAIGHHGRLTRENEFPGTHQYMSPEQARSESADPAMDVYAFGVTLADMLIGLTVRNHSREAFLELQRDGKITPPRIDTRVHAKVPRALADLVGACTTLVPGERPTIDEVVTRLDETLATLGMPAESSGPAMAAVGVYRREVGPARATEPMGERPTATTLLSPPPILIKEETPIGSSPVVMGRFEARLPWGRVVGAALVVVVGVPTVAAIARWDSPSILVTDEAVPWNEADGAERDPAPRTHAAPETPQAHGVEPTKASGISPAPSAPIREPKSPSAGKKPAPLARKVKTRAKPKRSGAPEEPLPADGDECIALRVEAEQAAASAAWAKVVKLTVRGECWSSRAERERLRVRALFESQAWNDCVDEGRESSEPRVQHWVDLCQRHVD